MTIAVETRSASENPPAVAVRCNCCGRKKAAELHPRRGLTIRFGHGTQNKHQACLSPRELLRLLSGAETPAGVLAYVRGLLREEAAPEEGTLREGPKSTDFSDSAR
ncbi:MAG: hypothetical protein ACE5Q6_24125 [Dehalococcoidia bacterium]